MDSKNGTKQEVQDARTLWLAVVVWLLPIVLVLFAVLLIDFYWDRWGYAVLVGVAVFAAACVAYYVTLGCLGRAAWWEGVKLKLLAAYAFAACLILLIFQGMSILQLQMNQAGEVGDMNTVLQLNLGYAGLGVLAGILLHVHGWIRLCRGKVHLNGWIIPAFLLLYIAPVYKILYVAFTARYGLSTSGLIGLVGKVLSMQDLQLALLLLAGVTLVRGLTRKSM